MELEVQRIRGLVQAHRFGEAVAAGCIAAHSVSRKPGRAYLLALAQRHTGRFADALDTLADMERHHPGASRLYQERGHCYVALKDAPHAIEAYERAVRINPALPDAWSMLEGLYKMVGDDEHRQSAAAHCEQTEVGSARGHHRDRHVLRRRSRGLPRSIIRAFLLRHGDHVEAMRLLARIGVARDILDDAEVLLAAALKMAPDYIELRRDYACVLLDRHKHAEAIAELDGLLALDPKNIDYRDPAGHGHRRARRS